MIQEIHLQTAVSKATILTFGAAVKDLIVFNRNVVLTLPSLEDYETLSGSYGATCGRVANRIKNGRFSLNGRDYQLELNQDNTHHRHGGFKGFSKRAWEIESQTANKVTLSLHSPAGEGGYPGTLDVKCIYTLNNTTLRIDYLATSDEDTIINMLHHSYFNLGGDVSKHHLTINAAHFTPADKHNIPTGEIKAVANTTYDFTHPRAIGETLYDNNFCIEGEGFREMATLIYESLAMNVFSNQPGLQCYDGHMLAQNPRSGICLEPQRYPDTPNNPQFGSCLLKKGESYHQHTEYRFYQP